jgi:hypothetical protein
MATANKYTQQTPIAGESIRAVLADRVYVTTSGTDYADPAAKLEGDSEPAGSPAWVDLGVVANSKATLTYNKEVKYVETGIDKVRRATYLTGKNAQLAFTLEQYDMVVIQAISGLTEIAVGAVGSKIFIGQEDIIEKAVLIVSTNKIDNKEHHLFSKKAYLTFQVGETDDYRVMNVTAELTPFLPTTSPVQTIEALFVLYILD